ncbi:MAG: TetR/AcrR family transcriptional regulator [Myxococcales bacterium]|nr:TetR/AcrR family transcriptional regulator [Myxococcales bacterium]
MSAAASRKRRDILEAATAVFRDEGYDAASMDRIAERAGASKRTVYNHFGSKEALFQAVVATLMADMHALKRLPFDPARPVADQLADYARSKTAVTENPSWMALLRVLLGVFARDPALAQATLRQAMPADDPFVAWLEAAHAAGALDAPDATVAAPIFQAMLAGALFWPQVLEGPLPAASRARITAELIATFLARFGVER